MLSLAACYQGYVPVNSRGIRVPAIQADKSGGSPNGRSDQDDAGVHTQGL